MDRYRFLTLSKMSTLSLATGMILTTFTTTSLADDIVPPAPSGDSATDSAAQPGSTPRTFKDADANLPMPPLPAVDANRPVKNGLPDQAVVRPVPNESVAVEGGWTVQITPKRVRSQRVSFEDSKDAASVKVDPARYNEIYRSIPYRRSEYLANPSYRHDATMEILFGQMRPTVIHRSNQPERVVNPRPQLYQSPALFQMLEFWRNTNSAWWSPSFVRPFGFPPF